MKHVTERTARYALELHRLVMAAEDALETPSPAAQAERNCAGVPDPTAGWALDPRRDDLRDAVKGAAERAERAFDALYDAIALVSAALDRWQTQ
mgnify:CR=1 FL=1